MIPRQRQRLIKARQELLAVPHRFLERTAGSHDSDLRGIDDWGEIGPSNAAETGDRKSPTLHLIRLEFAVARKLGKFTHFPSNVDDALFVGITNDWHDESLRRIGG